MNADQFVELKSSILIYLRTRTENESPSGLKENLTFSYVFDGNRYCKIEFTISRDDVVKALKDLEKLKLAKFAGGRMWTLTDEGKKVADEEVSNTEVDVPHVAK